MSCCAADAAACAGERTLRAAELNLAADDNGAGRKALRFSVPSMHCGACVAAIESGLGGVAGVTQARANLSTRIVSVQWEARRLSAADVVDKIAALGFDAHPVDSADAEDADAAESRDLLTRMAVAGFASANVMLLSVSVWAGAEDATRDLLHWISALIALPASAYASRPFAVSALKGLRAGRLNMDAPITLAIFLAAGLSLSEVTRGGEHAYFDAAVTLPFLLLIGRWLDRRMRAQARSAARSLARLAPRGAWVIDNDGAREYRPAAQLRAGDLIALSAGDRVPVDGVIETGRASVDSAALTGESEPVGVGPGDAISSGAAVLDAPLTLRASAVGEDTVLAEIARLCAAAESRKSKLGGLADQAAAVYAPLVHAVAAATFFGWMAAGLGAHGALMIAAAVLIVTCPCALGLAAPMTQAVASGALFRRGVMLKDGAALERLALVKAAAFDKTGVLTTGEAQVIAGDENPENLSAAAALAGASRHPLAQALSRRAAERGAAPALATNVTETPGGGVAGGVDGVPARLGSAAFCGLSRAEDDDGAPETWLVREGAAPVRFVFQDELRPDAKATLDALRAAGLSVRILSGDRPAAVRRVADRLGVDDWRGGLTPQEKIAAVQTLESGGAPVLMVGDGINDAPALAAASVSMAPAAAADVGRAAADMVFSSQSLWAVAETRRTAVRARAVILQNFALAAIYNAVAIPVAAAGLAGPLVAAIAMSSSSLIVTLNALRLQMFGGRP